MTARDTRVILVSNDVVPGSAVPVAAPGLRVFGLAEGLRRHGFDVTIAVVRHVAQRLWGRSLPVPTVPGTELVAGHRLRQYLEARAPAVVILTNSNQIEHVERSEGVRIVFDFFAPKMLEQLCHPNTEAPLRELETLRQRKLRALRRADAVIVNGRKKVPYVLAWLLQTGRDVRDIPTEVVNMAVPLHLREGPRTQGPLRFAIAGYLQPWSVPGDWLAALSDMVDKFDARLHVLWPGHWGARAAIAEHPLLARLRDHDRVRFATPMVFSAFQEFVAGMDVIVDLFDHNLEREYAMVTRTIVALSCGVPVIHPPFTEVSPMIAEWDAGWLVDPRDEEELSAVLAAAAGDPRVSRRKAEGARAMATECIDPRKATAPLARILDALPR